MLGVAAVGENSEPASFSSDNISVQVAAPGVEVPAQGRDGQYWLVSGTSPACALTAGVAALIKSAYPSLPPDLVREAITSSTSDRPAHGYDDDVGFGNVDAAAALKAAGRLSARGLAGPGSPRTGLRRTAILTPGVSADSHFGGGPAAISPPPVAPRGVQQLVLFCVLAAVCLAMIVIATSRLVLMRRPARTAGYPGAAPDGAGPGPPDGAPPGAPYVAGNHTAPLLHPWPAAPPGHPEASEGQQGAAGPANEP